jgi:hypothetical protein
MGITVGADRRSEGRFVALPTGNCRENISICVVFQLQIMKKRANYELTGDGTAVPYNYPNDDCRGRVLIGVIFQLHYPKSR